MTYNIFNKFYTCNKYNILLNEKHLLHNLIYSLHIIYI